MPWTCAMCSYAENNNARTRCEVCDAQKPAQAATPARVPTPAGPDWACPTCTLMNAGSNVSCSACTTNRPAAYAASRAAPPARPIPAGMPAARVPAPAAVRPAPAPSSRPSPSPSPPVVARPSPSPAANPPTAARSATPTTAAQPSEADVSALSAMGFSRAQSMAALSASKNNRDAALELLLTQAASSPPPPAKPASSGGAAASSSASAKPAAPAVPAVKKLSPVEQKAFEAREAKRLALLKQLDDEAAAKVAKAKAKAAAAAAAASTATVAPAAAAATKKASSAAPASASVISASASAAPAPAPTAAPAPTPEQIKLASIQAEREAEAAKAQMAKLRVQKRLEAESKLKSLPDVLAALRNNYDAIRFTAIVQMLRKIIDKVITDKGVTEKYRRIPLDNPKLELVLLRPIGPIWILKQVGFVEQVEGGSSGNGPAPMDVSDSESASDSQSQPEQRILYLPANKVNLKALQSMSSTLAQQLVEQSSIIPATFQELQASGRYSIESLYHLALELKHIVHNICISVDEVDEHHDDEEDGQGDAMSDQVGAGSSSRASSRRDTVNRNFRTIDKLDPAYQKRVKPIVESKRILAELGFARDPHDATHQFLVVPKERLSEEGGLKRYQIMLRELNGVIAQLQALTPIAVELRSLCARNRQKPMERFVSLLLEALRLVIANPHEQKFHRIVLPKLQAKVGQKPGQQIAGMGEFVKLFGFEDVPMEEGADVEAHAAAGRVALPYPGYDVEVLQIRADELERNWKEGWHGIWNYL